MSVKRMILFGICLFFIVSCGSIRKTGIKISEEELKNVEAARIVATNYLEVWPMQSGFIRGALGPRLSMLPQNAIEAMDELDKLAEIEGTLDDQDLGKSLGLRVQLLSDIVLEAIRIYAPDVFAVIGALAG